MEKLLEAFSRQYGRLPYREIGEIILCINVSRYLPKEKDETNLHEDALGESTKARKEQKRKQIKASRRLVLAEYLKGKKRKLAHEYVIFYRRGNYLIEGKTSPINRSLILLIFLIPHKLEIESLSF